MDKIIYCTIGFIVWTAIVVGATSIYNARSYAYILDAENIRYNRLNDKYTAVIEQYRNETDATAKHQFDVIRGQQDTILRQSATIEGQRAALQLQSGIINEIKVGTGSMGNEICLVRKRAREVLEILDQLPATN